MKKIYVSISLIVFLGVLALANQVSAATTGPNLGDSVRVGSSTTASTTRRAVNLDKLTANLQTRATKEIDRRVTALSSLLTRVQAMVKVSDSEKATFNTTIQAQIDLLNNLKTKIAADTDVATLKTDVQSITKAYRIYALVLPQIQIIAAADRLASTTDLLTAFAVKLQTRITAAQTAGKDTTNLANLLTDANNKITDANNQSLNAMTGVISLKPDNGDKTVMTANTAALKAARANIKTGTQDLKTAYSDGMKIQAGLRAFEEKNATSTASTTAH